MNPKQTERHPHNGLFSG